MRGRYSAQWFARALYRLHVGAQKDLDRHAATVYVLRWMAGKQAGIEFDPLYTVTA